MFVNAIYSDQLYTWSDTHAKPICCRLKKTASSSSTPAPAAPGHSARLPHRALQTLWQAGMQMCRRSWPWAQVLSFSELSGVAAANGICAARLLRADHRVRCQLSPGSRTPRGDLRDQPRASTAPRGALRCSDGRCRFFAHRPARNRLGWRAFGQHARSLARGRIQRLGSDGGAR
jgi:hypothetical protein